MLRRLISNLLHKHCISVVVYSFASTCSQSVVHLCVHCTSPKSLTMSFRFYSVENCTLRLLSATCSDQDEVDFDFQRSCGLCSCRPCHQKLYYNPVRGCLNRRGKRCLCTHLSAHLGIARECFLPERSTKLHASSVCSCWIRRSFLCQSRASAQDEATRIVFLTEA